MTMAGICGIPDFSSLFDKANSLLDRISSLVFLLLIIVLILVGGLIVANLLAGRGRG